MVELIRTGSKGQLASLHELEIAQGRKDRPKEEKQLLVGLFRLQGCTFNLSYLKGETFNVNEFRHHNILSTSHYYLRIPYGNPQSQINESAARRPHYLKILRHGENFQEEAHLSFQKDYTEHCELVNQLVISV